MNERTEPYLRTDTDAPAPEGDAGERRVLRQRRRRERTLLVLVAVLAALALAAVVSIVSSPGPRSVLSEAPPRPSSAESANATSPPAPARHPLDVPDVQQPPLDMSDATLLAGLATVFGDRTLSAYVEPANVVRRIVATVDNLPRRHAPPAQWPVKAAPGVIAVETTGSHTAIAPANALRYVAYVRLLESVDVARFVDLYRRHYPLFQQAYRELGYPDGHFNDRAVEAIDVLMATPSLEEPPELVQPKVFLQFADRDLEQLPVGQKLMLRVGGANAKRVNAKLAEIRAAITQSAVPAAR